MTTPNAYDWSFAHMPAAVAKRHGAKVIMGYLSWDSGKNMSSAEIHAHHRLNIGVVLGWESLEGRALGGAKNGREDAAAALAQMKTHVANLGYAPKVPVAVPFAVDQDVNPSQFRTILSYLRAAQKVFDADTATIRLAATAYGEYDLIEFLAAHGIGKGLFQTYAWSNGQVSKHAALYQFLNNQTVEGFGVDEDKVTNAHALAAWWPPNHPLNRPEVPHVTPTPAPTPHRKPKHKRRPRKAFHVVEQGDTLAAIAHAARIGLPRLYRLNRWRHPFLRRNARRLQVGWKIRIR